MINLAALATSSGVLALVGAALYARPPACCALASASLGLAVVLALYLAGAAP